MSYGLVKQSQWETSRKDCSKCKKGFGIFTSKVNCPRCGSLMCKDCCMSEIALTNPSKPDRVCIDCFIIVKEIKEGKRAPIPNYGEASPTSPPAPASPLSPQISQQQQPQSASSSVSSPTAVQGTANSSGPLSPSPQKTAAKAPPPGVYNKVPPASPSMVVTQNAASPASAAPRTPSTTTTPATATTFKSALNPASTTIDTKAIQTQLALLLQRERTLREENTKTTAIIRFSEEK